MDYKKYIEDHTMQDSNFSERGGSLKVDAGYLFPYIDDAVVGAYQNYLGGGMLGRIVGAAMFMPDELHKKDLPKFNKLLDACKRYIHEQTNHIGDEWEEQTYIQNQSMPVSAY
jgi:hypothetical protein